MIIDQVSIILTIILLDLAMSQSTGQNCIIHVWILDYSNWIISFPLINVATSMCGQVILIVSLQIDVEIQLAIANNSFSFVKV